MCGLLHSTRLPYLYPAARSPHPQHALKLRYSRTFIRHISVDTSSPTYLSEQFPLSFRSWAFYCLNATSLWLPIPIASSLNASHNVSNCNFVLRSPALVRTRSSYSSKNALDNACIWGVWMDCWDIVWSRRGVESRSELMMGEEVLEVVVRRKRKYA